MPFEGEQGYIIEFAPRADNAAVSRRRQIASDGAATSTAATAPLPAAVILFPLGAGVAIYMGRRFR